MSSEGQQRLTERCTKLFATLVIPTPFTLVAFVSNVADRRGKPIELVPIHWQGAACGLVLQTNERDFICYATGTTPLHTAHIAIHELGHLLLGHGGSTPGGDINTLARRLPYLSPALIRRVLGPTEHPAQHEREAETFATMVLAQAGQQVPGTSTPQATMNGLHAAFDSSAVTPQNGAATKWHVPTDPQG